MTMLTSCCMISVMHALYVSAVLHSPLAQETGNRESMQWAHCRWWKHWLSAAEPFVHQDKCQTTYVPSRVYATHAIACRQWRSSLRRWRQTATRTWPCTCTPGRAMASWMGVKTSTRWWRVSSYPLSVMPVCGIAQQQNLIFPDSHVCCAVKYSTKVCEVLWVLPPAATCV